MRYYTTSSGGFTSLITGGDSLQGAVQGLVVYFANHLAHEGAKKKDSEVVVMEDKDGAYNQRHMAILGGNDKKGWNFVSKDGRKGVNTENPEGTHLTGAHSETTKNLIQLNQRH